MLPVNELAWHRRSGPKRPKRFAPKTMQHEFPTWRQTHECIDPCAALLTHLTCNQVDAGVVDAGTARGMYWPVWRKIITESRFKLA